MMKGQATKQRLYLIKAFIAAMGQFKDKPESEVLGKMLELVRSMVIELITSINNSNLKIRKLAEEGFLLIQDVLRPFKANSQLLQTLLVGLAGTTPQLQSSTIRALVFNMKQLVVTHRTMDESKLVSSEPNVQEFIRKITKIIALFLKDQAAPKELHRSALKFIKVAITYLNFDAESGLT